MKDSGLWRNKSRRCAAFALAVLFLLVLLSGCHGRAYEQAAALQESGGYEAAYDIFSRISDYEDANWRMHACAEADVQACLNAGEINSARQKLEKYAEWSGTKWYKRMLSYTDTAAAGSYAEEIRFENCRLSCVVHLDAPVEGQYLRLTLSAPEDSDIYGRFAYTTPPKEDMDPEDAEQYFDVRNYARDGGYVLDQVNISNFKYTLPAMSDIYDMGIFRPETQAMMSALSYFNPHRDVVSPGGKEGVSFSDTIDYALFNSADSGPVDSLSYAFAGGILYLDIMSPEDDILLRQEIPVPAL